MEQIITLAELKKKFPYTFIDNMGKEKEVINIFYSHTKKELHIYFRKSESINSNHF
jgi:hypothetical protein